ncbi:MAG: ABC transporter ATP-binding protein [Chloroflexi bacterium]|nr:ABC transporter ATP-binding protein [Chloroflexota bacterium]
MATTALPASTPFDFKTTVSDNRLKALWRMMTGFRLLYSGATLALGFAAIFKTLTFLLLAYFIDDVLEKRHFEYIGLVALGFVALAAMEGFFTFLSGKWAARTAEGVTRRLRNFLFDHVQRLSFGYHDKHQTGDLLQRSTSDVDAVRLFLADQAIGAGRIALLFIVNFTAIMLLNWKLALASVVVIPPIFIVSIFFFRRIEKSYEKFQEQESVLSTILQENLTGVRVVKAFARQQWEMDKFEKENWEKYARGRKLTINHAYFWPTTDIICSLQMIGGFMYGATLAIDGEISLGTYLAYAGMVVWLIWPIRNLGRLITQMSIGVVSYGRVMEMIKEDRESLIGIDKAPHGELKGEIIFKDVSFEYDKDSHVLRNISFAVKPGQSVALMGPTGSGKTSVVNLLPRFYEYTSGSITLDGLELKEYSKEFLRENIGIVEQQPFLFSRNIRENITYGVSREVSDEEVEAAARAAAVHDVILTFPKGYQTLVGERGVTLSGGQKQRVAIARTLLKNPRLLLLDDATSSVDTETEGEIREALQNLMENRTTFIIAHRIQSVMNADLILVLDKGQIVQRGTHDELVEQDGIYRQIYDMQARIETELEKEIAGV